ncbi:MAG: Tol-Pal system protein TolB [Campylobacterales bacterium]|nr:Tol-Pal system protein TolB [Campylobacterales bacterium]
MNYIVVFLLFISNIFAVDATMEIVKRLEYIPGIVIEEKTMQSDNAGYYSKKIHKVLVGDFKVSGHFNVDDTLGSFSDFESLISLNPNVKGDLLLKYETITNSDGSLLVNAKLINLKGNSLLFSKSYTVSKSERFPFLAHKIAVDVNKQINAPSIEWMENFVVFSKFITAKQSDIVISDYTLTFQKTVVKGGFNIFPKWADKSKESFYYTKYLNKPTLFKYNLFSGKNEKIIESDGMLSCSDVSEDGTKLLLTMAPKGQPDIFVFDINSKTKKQVTNYSGIDVNGNFVDDDKRIVFVSDRLGYPNIFAQTIGSSGVEQLVYQGKNNNSCTAFKNYIVYTSRESENEFGGNTFNLYMISTKSDFIRRLTPLGDNQFPKFSQDGESIIYIRNYKNQSALGIIRVNYNKSYLYPLQSGKIQSIDW